MVGADTVSLREFAQALGRAADHLSGVESWLLSAGTSLAWMGADREQALGWLRGDGRRLLGDVAGRVREASSDLIRQADEQDRASGTGGTFAGVGGGPAAPQERNKFWFWEDGFAWPWGDTADLQDDIPIDDGQFTLDNVDQENFPDCQAVSALGVLGRQDPDYFQDRIKRVGPEKYEVTLYDANGKPKVYTVEGDVPRGGVRAKDGNQSWMTLYEAALIQAGVLHKDGSYGDSAGMGVYQAVLGVSGDRSWVGKQGYPGFEGVQQAVASGRSAIVGTVERAISDESARAAGVEPLQIVENHAYMVDSVNSDGTITLVNPWGPESRYAGDHGSHRLTVTQAQYRLYFDQCVISPPRTTWK